MDTHTPVRYWYPFQPPKGKLNRKAYVIMFDPFDWALPLSIEYEEHGDGKFYAWEVKFLCIRFRMNRFRNYLE